MSTERLNEQLSISPERQQRLDEITAWRGETQMRPALIAKYDIFYYSLEDDAMEAPVSKEPRNDPADPAQPDAPAATTPLDRLQDIWRGISFATDDTRFRYENLAQALRAAGLGEATVKLAQAEAEQSLRRIEIEIHKTGAKIAGTDQIIEFETWVGPRGGYARERKATLELFEQQPDLKVNFRELWGRIAGTTSPPKSAIAAHLDWLDRFIKDDESIFDISKQRGYLATVGLAENTQIQLTGKVAETAKSGHITFEGLGITPQDLYDGIYYFFDNKDIREKLAYVGLPSVTPRMLKEVEEISARSDGAGLTAEEEAKHARTEQVRRLLAAQEIVKFLKEQSNISELTDMLAARQVDAPHFINGFLMRFKGSEMQVQLLERAWREHLRIHIA